MELFTIDLVFNAPAQLFPDDTLSSFTNFLLEQLILEGQWEVAISVISYPSINQTVTGGSLCFLITIFLSRLKFTIWSPVSTLPLRILLKPWTLSFEKHFHHSESYMTIKVSRRTQNVDICLANEKSGLAYFSWDQGHNFGSNVGNEFGVILWGKGSHKPDFAYEIVRIHSLMIYTDQVEYNIVGDTKAPMQCCFLFISKLKNGDTITTGQYMDYQTFSNLQFRPQLKKLFHRVQIDLRDTGVEEIPFLPVGSGYHLSCFDV